MFTWQTFQILTTFFKFLQTFKICSTCLIFMLWFCLKNGFFGESNYIAYISRYFYFLFVELWLHFAFVDLEVLLICNKTLQFLSSHVVGLQVVFTRVRANILYCTAPSCTTDSSTRYVVGILYSVQRDIADSKHA